VVRLLFYSSSNHQLNHKHVVAPLFDCL
jgi:hypothetical protein